MSAWLTTSARRASRSAPTASPRATIRGRPTGASARALREVGRDADDFGVEIRLEIHGDVTGLVPNAAEILDAADDPNVFACWNSNPTDVGEDGSIAANFRLVAPRIREVHLRDLTDEAYPWRELFALLASQDFRGYTLAEIPASPDPERVLRYFRSALAGRCSPTLLARLRTSR